MTNAVRAIEIMSLLGIPTLFMMLCGLFKSITKQGEKIKILMDAQQAQMRRDLVKDYYQFKEAGSISQRDLDDWEAQYQAYHALGANGVLDSLRDDLFTLARTK